jgi:hypothetical protein
VGHVPLGGVVLVTAWCSELVAILAVRSGSHGPWAGMLTRTLSRPRSAAVSRAADVSD